MAYATKPPGLIQRYRELLQTRHYARRTVKTYEQWLRRFLRFHGMRHPREMGSTEVNAFLSHLAVNEQVSASTQTRPWRRCCFSTGICWSGSWSSMAWCEPARASGCR